ncbi:hypothetical protein BC2230_30594 [Burkholderia cepacia]
MDQTTGLRTQPLTLSAGSQTLFRISGNSV